MSIPFDLFNGFFGWGVNAWNMSEKSKWNNKQWDQYIDEWKHKLQMDFQAQMNYERNMQLQQDQLNFQQNQFEANRIGNLTKEYAEAGLNPYLAAGMGASTAGVVGGGGTAPISSNPGKPGINTSQTIMNQMKMENAMQMASLQMQKQMNDAQIGNINAQTELTKAQTDDITGTRNYRINKIQSEIGLNEAQAIQAIEQSNKLRYDAKYTEQLTKLAEKDIDEKTMQNNLNKIKHDLIMSMPETERQRILQEMKEPYYKNKQAELDMIITQAEFRRDTIVQREKLINEWWDSTVGLFIKAGSGKVRLQ